MKFIFSLIIGYLIPSRVSKNDKTDRHLYSVSHIKAISM
ncbi:hypothetical protein KL86DYS2_12369 [uncultured Dysgonomonas sp.]|uniref:Uncharacterized protein n=1 Tax=uncultured Dysgonomonas sp. TaxID=206096 RepID=A0A212JUW4_9BACT|nr:hypothetical protein KL86DYS2_12369 [uncultured Dysgonomonas sp.]